MNPELVILALVSTFRIASLAAVYALLQRESAAKLLIAYIVVGFAFVFSVGAVVVLALHGVDVSKPAGTFRRVAELIAGAALLLLALFAFAGRLPTDAPMEQGGASWARKLDDRVGVRGAAIAGVATHIPGVFYLVALDLIISGHPKSALVGLGETAVFDALWFALPVAALLAVIYRPEKAREAVDRIRSVASERAPLIIGVVSAVLGAALLIDALRK